MLRSFSLIIFLKLVLVCITNNAYSQEKCGTTEYQKQLSPLHLQNKDKFENWMKSRIEENKVKDQSTFRIEGTEALVTIPVVVHIVHNGEPYGTGVNITDEQIFSQIAVLNEDFTRTNADKANTPADFSAVAANIEVNFVLAKRDPEGLATTGIIRVQGSKTSWTFDVADDDRVLKAHSYWPAEDYLNIWVTESSWLGWAQFPVSNLEGLEDSSNNRLTDGVVIDYQSFGSIDKYPEAVGLKDRYALGRTTTHEVGHFLGLNHIWGDGGCNVDDYCEDTPSASKENYTQDCVYPGPNSCTDSGIDFPDMFQNYMDYSDDTCMNLFTLDQKSRITTVLANSPRRKSLTTSKGGTAPVIVANDLGIRSIVSPDVFTCSNNVTPQIEIRNYGNNDVTQLTVETLLNNSVVQTNSLDIELRVLETMIITLSPISIFDMPEQELTFRITNTNNSIDGNSDNNIKSITIIATPEATLPLSESFNLTPKDWRFYSPEGGFHWKMIQLTHKSPGDSSIMLNCFDYEILNEETFLLSPKIDLSNLEFASLSFEMAHSNFTGYFDELKVIISTDCGNTFPESNVIYAKSGDELRTTSFAWPDEFAPISENDWRLEQIDLSAYLGQQIQIGFVGVNGYGNNIFLDNIRIISSKFTDIGINAMLSPSPVLGVSNHDLVFETVNLGSKIITSFDYAIYQNGGPAQHFSIDGVSILPGQNYAIEHGIILGLEGTNTLEIELINPNDTIDVNLGNNSLIYYYNIDATGTTLPLREKFEDESIFIVNTQYPNEIKWEQFNMGSNTAMMVNGGEHPHINAQEWLVTPSIDMSKELEASMYFDISYALPLTQNSDFLQILVSDNNGLSYTPTTYSKNNLALATTSEFKDNWIPSSSNEWRRDYLDLSEYAGKEDIRVAFVFYNRNANALYIDNIEFYVEANPDTLSREKEVVIGPNPIVQSQNKDVLNVYFQLNKKQPVMMSLYNQTGQLLYAQQFSNVLNQHYELPIDNLPAGLVILRTVGTTFQETERIVVIK